MPATLESMCFSPQATSQNGIAALRAPRITAGRQLAASSVKARRPSLTTRYAASRIPAKSARAAIIGAGSTSSTATLMSAYEAPQIAARRKSIGQ